MVTVLTADVYRILQEVKDPEIPVISVVELGIVRNVCVDDEQHVDIYITPTYSGCPAMDVIPVMIRQAVVDAGYHDVTVHSLLSPAWTTDWITEEGRKKLYDFGIAPPDVQKRHAPEYVECPHCGSKDTEVISFFGSTPCKAAYRCKACLEPFDYFKCH
jgi:ring-1,2-phenylacetyl-CoA epoxidase subunit PaaD